jgi:beta-RFAP synthase
MFSFGQPDVRQFGGVGCMIDRPGIKLVISPAREFTAIGPLAERVRLFAETFTRMSGTSAVLRCKIEVVAAPSAHVGLGSGTQLGLAVAAGLNAFLHGTSVTDVKELAQLAGRGRRSAIGVHGFAQGGLLIEAGKTAEGEISPLIARTELPGAWRFVLLCPKQLQGLSGAAESRAFEEQLSPVPLETTGALCHEAFLNLLPAAIEGHFAAFSESLFQFGHLAGSCFASLQGGPYAGAQVTQLVERCRALGVLGVGQTSWGPTVFALLPNEQESNEFIEKVATGDLNVIVARANNQGALIEMTNSA